jgi:hypothetical protein
MPLLEIDMLLKGWRIISSWGFGVFNNPCVVTLVFRKQACSCSLRSLDWCGKVVGNQISKHSSCNRQETTRSSTCCKYAWKYRISSFVSWALREDPSCHMPLRQICQRLVSVRRVLHSQMFHPYKLIVVKKVIGSDKMNRLKFLHAYGVNNRRPRKWTVRECWSSLSFPW